MNDNDKIEVLNIPTRVYNGLRRNLLETVGDLKNYIRKNGCTGIRNVGSAGWHTIVKALRPYVDDSDEQLILAIGEYISSAKHCSILQKACPVDGKCDECTLLFVFKEYSSMTK